MVATRLYFVVCELLTRNEDMSRSSRGKEIFVLFLIPSLSNLLRDIIKIILVSINNLFFDCVRDLQLLHSTGSLSSSSSKYFERQSLMLFPCSGMERLVDFPSQPGPANSIWHLRQRLKLQMRLEKHSKIVLLPSASGNTSFRVSRSRVNNSFASCWHLLSKSMNGW